MNAQSAFAPAKPFNAMEAYHRERGYSRSLEQSLSRALILLGAECTRRELRGEDVSHIRDFIARASA